LESLERIKLNKKSGQTHRSAPTENNVGVNLCVHPEKIIISHHNFSKTPDLEFLKNILKKMQKYSPEVYKIAVTPENEKDVDIIFKLNKYFLENFYNSPIIPFQKGDEQKNNIFISM
jgi:3-dehydroquinate dehydratase type I